MESTRVPAKWIGFLFLLAMGVSIAGNLILMSLIGAEDLLEAVADQRWSIPIYGLLMLTNSFAVAGIGLLCMALFRAQHPIVAFSYLAARVVESIVLVVGILAVLTLPGIAQEAAVASAESRRVLVSLSQMALDTNWHAYHVAMIALGLGSLSFVYRLLAGRLVPGYLAVLGLIGYAILAATSILALLGMQISLIVTLPVFVFEVALGVYLIFRGFRPEGRPG